MDNWTADNDRIDSEGNDVDLASAAAITADISYAVNEFCCLNNTVTGNKSMTVAVTSDNIIFRTSDPNSTVEGKYAADLFDAGNNTVENNTKLTSWPAVDASVYGVTTAIDSFELMGAVEHTDGVTFTWEPAEGADEYDAYQQVLAKIEAVESVQDALTDEEKKVWAQDIQNMLNNPIFDFAQTTTTLAPVEDGVHFEVEFDDDAVKLQSDAVVIIAGYDENGRLVNAITEAYSAEGLSGELAGEGIVLVKIFT